MEMDGKEKRKKKCCILVVNFNPKCDKVTKKREKNKQTQKAKRILC